MRKALLIAALMLSACSQATVEEYPATEESAPAPENLGPSEGSLPTTQPSTDPTGSEEAAAPAQ